MSAVLDAGVVVAALVGTGAEGAWADRQMEAESLAAPHLMPVEVANVLRKAVSAASVPADVARSAHRELVALPVELFAYEALAERVWALRENLTTYDGWYVALAESLDAPLVTLDRRLARAPGPRCEFRTPDEP
ncbi:MAG TPA: type II toxin-antitoxin system VapC family toxin [Actinomycetales bacterium]|nr:type II toxin-antitoxin system VapC family toxin [Actinomycetales bacterium]